MAAAVFFDSRRENEENALDETQREPVSLEASVDGGLMEQQPVPKFRNRLSGRVFDSSGESREIGTANRKRESS